MRFYNMEKFDKESVATTSTSASNRQNTFSSYAKRPRFEDCIISNFSMAYSNPFEHSSNELNISHTINPYTEPSEEEILEWQEAQLSRSIVDNTVNRVVESYITLFDDDINLPNTGLEESAILMAINEHGLQQNNSDDQSTVQSRDTIPLVAPRILQTCNSSSNHNTAELILNNEETSFSNDLENYAESNKKIVTVPPSTNSIYSDDGGSDSEHFDFIEAAVAVAIRKKGLTPYSIEMSPNR